MTPDKKEATSHPASEVTSTPEKSGDKDPKAIAAEAHEQAESDIDKDPDMELPTENDDLDEGELANLGGDKNDLV